MTNCYDYIIGIDCYSFSNSGLLFKLYASRKLEIIKMKERERDRKRERERERERERQRERES